MKKLDDCPSIPSNIFDAIINAIITRLVNMGENLFIFISKSKKSDLICSIVIVLSLNTNT